MNDAHTYSYTATAPAGVAGVAHTLQQSLVWPGLAAWAAVILIAGTGGAALRSPLILVAAVPWLARAAVPNWRYWVLAYHYSLLPAIALFFAALDGGALHHSIRVRRRMGIAVVLSGAAALATLAPHLVGDPASARTALARIPDGADVAAPPNLSAHLATRTSVTLMPNREDPHELAAATEWIILDDQQPPPATLRSTLTAWKTVYRGPRYTVLHR